jgi:hypothetical protein
MLKLNKFKGMVKQRERVQKSNYSSSHKLYRESVSHKRVMSLQNSQADLISEYFPKPFPKDKSADKL